jgi:hypothetical protein
VGWAGNLVLTLKKYEDLKTSARDVWLVGEETVVSESGREVTDLGAGIQETRWDGRDLYDAVVMRSEERGAKVFPSQDIGLSGRNNSTHSSDAMTILPT